MLKDNKLNNGVKIVNVEGKDIKRGYSFLNKKGELATYKFKGNFDFSLGIVELEKLCEEKGIELYEEKNGELYSKILVCLTFKYSDKNNDAEVEKVISEKLNKKQQYIHNVISIKVNNSNDAKEEIKRLRIERDKIIKAVNKKRKAEIKEELNEYKNTLDIGNNSEESVMLTDIKKSELEAVLAIEIKAIKDEYREKIEEIRLNRDSSTKDMKNEVKVELKENIKELNNSLTCNGIREGLYQDGFIIDGKTYIRYLRSSGSARVGKCLFILEDVYEEMIAYSLAGNEVAKDMVLDLPSWEAYLGLSNTALEDVMSIEAKNILLVDKITSDWTEPECMVTELINGELYTSVKSAEISNSLFDGSSLIDFSLIDEEYCIAGGVQLRNKWYKGFSVACDIQGFFKEHKITEIKQLNGWTIATDIKDVKLICTSESVKYLKYNKGLEGFKKWLDIISNVWGICGHPHESKFVGGEYVQAHYQLLNNINLTEADIELVAKESKEYAELLKNDLEVFKMHLAIENNEELEDEENIDYSNFNVRKMKDGNNFINTMIQMNDDFQHTKVFKRHRKDMIDNFVENCKRGHLLIYGCYAVVIMNSIDYLYHAIDKNWKPTIEQSHMEHKSMMCDYFDYDKELLCSRSPMPVQGNILIAKNVENKEIRDYFSYNGKLSPYIMHINAIENNCCERGSGFDSDGDKFLITDQSTLLFKAKANYDKFLVPVNKVKSNEEIEYKWNNYNKALLDEKCSQNNIGRIINDSMILVSEYWHRINNGSTHEELKDLYKVICELSIMSNLAIDACKRPVPYNEEKALQKIENSEWFRERETIQVKIKDTWEDKKGKKHNKKYKGIDGKKHQVYKKMHIADQIIRNGNIRLIIPLYKNETKDKNAKVRPAFFKLVGQGQEYYFDEFDCSMDYLQKAMKIKKKGRGQSDLSLSELFSDEANKFKTGDAQDRVVHNVIDIIKELNQKIVAINLNDNIDEIEKNEQIKEKKREAVLKLHEIRKGNGIKPVEIITLIKRLDKDYCKKNSTELTEIGKLLLSTLYEAYQKQFILMFRYNMKPTKKLILDETGDIKIFNKRYKKIEFEKIIKVNFLKKEKLAEASNFNG